MRESKDYLNDKIRKLERKVLEYREADKSTSRYEQQLWILDDIANHYFMGEKYSDLKKSLDNNNKIVTYIGWNKVEIIKK